MNVAVLWKDWNDYLEASLDALSRVPGTRVLLCEAASRNPLAPQGKRYAAVERCQLSEGISAIAARLEQFEPDLLLVCSWNVKGYRQLARRWRGRAVRAVYIDNQWLGTARQRLAVLASPIYLWPCFDAAFVAGGRQSAFASRLGFTRRRLQEGGVVGDTTKFVGTPSRRGFVFVGRLVHEKGIDLLAKGYALYRLRRGDPWPLLVCGVGPDAVHLDGGPGVKTMGFVQPSELPAVLAQSACLVLPSRFEPFGVVVHEAAAMGLHVVASAAVGAADLFVEDYANGRIVSTGCVGDIADALAWVHDRSDEAMLAGSRRSRELGQRQSPDTWSSALVSICERFDLDRRSILRARPRLDRTRAA